MKKAEVLHAVLKVVNTVGTFLTSAPGYPFI